MNFPFKIKPPNPNAPLYPGQQSVMQHLASMIDCIFFIFFYYTLPELVTINYRLMDNEKKKNCPGDHDSKNQLPYSSTCTSGVNLFSDFKAYSLQELMKCDDRHTKLLAP